MAITGGFFNSLNGDRKYNADAVNNFFEGLISQGVFENVDDGLQVKASTGMTIQVGSGKLSDGSGRWLKNDAVANLTIESSDVTLNRYDAIVAAIDTSINKRTASIYIKKGTNATNPTKPTMTRNNNLTEYCLAYVYVGKGATAITQANITDTRPDKNLCGFVVGLIEQLDLTQAFLQYQTASEEDRTNNQADFNAWFDTIKETLSKSTLIRSYTSTYTTVSADETVIPINISQFNKELDILQIYINGLRLIPNVEYTLNSNSQITLILPVDAGTPISFEVFKSIDGSDAETVVSQVNALQNQVNTLENAVPQRLYSSETGEFPNPAYEVVPSKPLADCQHGWELMFTEYDDDNKVAKDFYVQTVHIPKRSYKGTEWSGESMTFPLVYSYDEAIDSNDTCTKTFTIYPDKFVSSRDNSNGKSRNMVLRAVYEY
jgi:hypothetical protein